MKCSYCEKEVTGEVKKVGPDLVYCSNKCFVFDSLAKYPDTSLADMLKTMHPKVYEEFSEQIIVIGIK